MEFVTFVQNPVSQWKIALKPPLLKGVLPRLLTWDASPSKAPFGINISYICLPLIPSIQASKSKVRSSLNS